MSSHPELDAESRRLLAQFARAYDLDGSDASPEQAEARALLAAFEDELVQLARARRGDRKACRRVHGARARADRLARRSERLQARLGMRDRQRARERRSTTAARPRAPRTARVRAARTSSTRDDGSGDEPPSEPPALSPPAPSIDGGRHG